MTTTTPVASPEAATTASPSRRVLVALAVVYVACFAVLMLNGTDNEPDADPAKLIAAHDVSQTFITWSSFGGMAVCGVLVFFGSALRAALAQSGRRWTADVAFIGFVVMALTLASWAVSGLALWQAQDLGDEAAVRAMNLVDTSNFLPAMLAMICAMVGTGLTGLATRTLPTWLSVASVVLGCLAPLGPAGFVPFLLFPVWMVVVAATVRLAPAEG